MDKTKISSFTDLIAWRKAHELALLIYKVTKLFPKDELFVLVSQMRRAAISVPSNIVEGFSRRGIKEKIQFYYFAKSSLSELKSQILIAHDLLYIEDPKIFEQLVTSCTETDKLIQGLIISLRKVKC